MKLYILNIGLAALRVISIATLIKVAAMGLTAEALGIFLLLRRYSAVGANIFQLGFSQSIMRYVPEVDFGKGCSLKYLITPVAILFLLGGGGTIFVAYAGHYASSLLFADQSRSYDLMMLLVFISWVSALDLLVRAFFLAKRKVFLSNFVEIFSGSLLLTSLLLFLSNVDIVTVLFLHSTLQLVILLITLFLQVPPREWGMEAITNGSLLNDRHELIKSFQYGVPRGAAAMLEMLVIATSAWGVSQFNLNAASGFLISMVLIRVVQAGVTPLSQLITVTAASGFGNAPENKLEEELHMVGGATLIVLLTSCGVIIPWSGSIVNIFFGDSEFSSWASKSFPILLFSIVPYGIYQFIKGVVDVRVGMPVNFISLLLVNIVIGVSALYTSEAGVDNVVFMSTMILASYIFIMLVAVGCSWEILKKAGKKMRIEWIVISSFFVFLSSFSLSVFCSDGSFYSLFLSVIFLIFFMLASIKVPLVISSIRILVKRK